MQIPGLLIEYLITGSGVLIGILLLSALGLVNVPLADPKSLVGLIPSLYVWGMLIDFLAASLLKPIKRSSREREFAGKEILPLQLITHQAPTLAAELSMRSSRDRIARGAALNVLIATIIVSTSFARAGQWSHFRTSCISGAILTSIFLSMWARFQTLTFKYHLQTSQVLREQVQSTQQEISPRSSEGEVFANEETD